jgi:hypothetical protein
VAILVDDKPYEPVGAPDQTVAELAHEVCDRHGETDQRIVVGVSCDGSAVGDDQLEGVLQSPWNRFERLELHTQSMGSLVRATLDQAVAAFEASAETRNRVADLLTEGQHESAMTELQSFLDTWKQVQEALIVCSEAFGIDLNQEKVNGLGVPEILDLIKEQLGALKTAMEQHDLVVVGDILRYELEEPLEHWLALLRSLRDRVVSRSS